MTAPRVAEIAGLLHAIDLYGIACAAHARCPAIKERDTMLAANERVETELTRLSASLHAAQAEVERLRAQGDELQQKVTQMQPIADAWDECAGEIGHGDALFATEAEWAKAFTDAVQRNALAAAGEREA